MLYAYCWLQYFRSIAREYSHRSKDFDCTAGIRKYLS